MIRAISVFLIIGSATSAQDLTAPSGLKMNLYEVLVDEDIPLARFRFEVPEIADNALEFAQVADDLQALCDETLLPSLKQSGWTDGQIILQLSAQKVAFGASAPDVTQYFQPFSIAGDTCIWEDY